jgi:glyoxylase-like metal-dependent hydrolase (beta-lactamase superfamily II)
MENPYQGAILPMTSVNSGLVQEVAFDLYGLTLQIVNVCFVGQPGSNAGYVLIDAGMPRSAEDVIKVAEERYGGVKPNAIILTHGHFDHVGAIVELIEKWNVPVYAHALEMPYLTGVQNYPEGDPTADGGLVSELSPFYPNEAIDISGHVQALPEDGTVPHMAGWRWIHTPGHTPGHLSLYREQDRALIAGDAFVTVKQESLYKVLTQEQEISGPPKYFTMDWKAAKESVARLESLKPTVAITGHGVPMQGEFLKQELERLVRNFDEIAVPSNKLEQV